MSNTNDKDFQVREDAFTDDLRVALRQREAKRQQTEVPADFFDNVMRQVEPQKTHAKTKAWRITVMSLTAAACIAFAILITKSKGDEQKPVEDHLFVHKEKTVRLSPSGSHTVLTTTPVASKKTHKTKAEEPVPQHVSAQTQSSEELEDYMAELENSLAEVCDSCYLAQVEHMISDNEELQRLMNEMTNHKQ